MRARETLRQWFNSLSLRVIAGMTAMTTAAVLLSGSAAGYFLSRDFDARIDAQNQQQAAYLMSLLDRNVLSGGISLLSTIRVKYRSDIAHLSSPRGFDYAGAKRLKDVLTSWLLPHENAFVSLAIYYREEEVLLSTREGLGLSGGTLPYCSDDSDWVSLYEAAGLKPGIRVLPQRLHQPSGENVISMVTSLSESDDSVWLCLNVSCAYLDELVSASLSGEETRFLLLDDTTGQCVYSYGEMEGEKSRSASAVSDLLRWTGILETSPQSAFGEGTMHNFLYAALGCTLILLTAGIFLSIKLTHRTSRSIAQANMLLTEAAPETPRGLYSIEDMAERIRSETVHQKQYLSESRSLIKENFLFALLSSESIDERARGQVLDFLKISFPHARFTCCVMEYRSFSSALKEEAVGLALREFIRQYQQTKVYMEYCRISPRRFALIVNYADEAFSAESLLSRLDDDLEGQFELRLHFGAGDSGDSLNEISLFSSQAISALRYSALYPRSLSFFYRETSLWDKNAWDREGFAEFCSFLSRGEKEACLEAIAGFGGTILKRHLSYNAYQEITSAVVREIEAFASRNMVDLRDLFENSLSDRLRALDSLEQVFAELRDCLLKVLDSRESNASRSTVYIRKAIQYMQENYVRDVSVQEIADALGLSRYYLSRLFKEATGSTMLAYLMQVRMEKSKELLRGEERLSVAEVAARVGFNSPSYFDKKFKQTFGCSPAAFAAGEPGGKPSGEK